MARCCCLQFNFDVVKTEDIVDYYCESLEYVSITEVFWRKSSMMKAGIHSRCQTLTDFVLTALVLLQKSE